eukprot:Cvel_12639.t1-p1 / transcript=Cvel_12639.t1 / gene=Cvel_12639 / organism=Chromera_velia_CCMP2878 / gene_product=Keratin-associated protein 5-4, putative / transcript_product=Keratin-associated protein 5-4, putative / location=Cvel_scaffold835:1-894(-) / protein_length=298 / sequence_SO=supercontig / SO=protein_coding / is_pseudo=false
MGRRVFEWDQVKALIACRLVALDKCPGVRPVGIGETIRRLLGKAVMKETREELQEACGAHQLCSGLMGGLEGGIHAVRELWETLTQEAGDDPEKAFRTLLIDAENAFNAANRTAGLWNARILWPRASTFLFNCYRGDAELFLRGTHGTTTISSREGWTQRDPMSMAGYAITILPLVRSLRGSGSGQTESEKQSEASGSSQAAGEKQTRMSESRQADRETQSETSESSQPDRESQTGASESRQADSKTQPGTSESSQPDRENQLGASDSRQADRETQPGTSESSQPDRENRSGATGSRQ